MTPFEEELKQLSNLSDEYINPIIDEYFQYATFDNILGDSFEDAFDNSQFIDSIYDIYNQLKKFEPVSLSYLERKIFGIICQELSTNVVMEDNSYNFFDDRYLINDHVNLGDKILNLFQKISTYQVKSFSCEVSFEPNSNNIIPDNFKIVLSDDRTLNENEIIEDISGEVFEIKNNIEKRLKNTIRTAINFEDWKILYADFLENYYNSRDENSEEAEHSFKYHLKSLELI